MAWTPPDPAHPGDAGQPDQPDAPDEPRHREDRGAGRGTPLLHRGIGMVVLGMGLGAAAMLWLALTLSDPKAVEPPKDGAVLGVWRVIYANQAPSLQVVLVAVAVALLAAAVVAGAEQRIATRYRRSSAPRSIPLGPKVVMAQTAGVFHGPVTVTVLIPAHDEEACIEATLTSLRDQDEPPERIVVVADNCTDATVAIARRAGVEVLESVDNDAKKAGALNQALCRVLPDQGENDLVMVMDADTVLDGGFLRVARSRMASDRALMALGGLFYGESGSGMIGQFQRNEYVRYSRDIRRRRGRVFVLTGTASLFRPRALRAVADARGRLIPGTPGDVYDTAALTEDNELTIALKSLGALMVSPPECTVVTEVMPTWRALWNQRLRWQRGALENLGAYGMAPQTLRYWAQQLGIGYGVIALASYAALVTVTLLSLDVWVWYPFWMGAGLVFVVERLVGVWAGGRDARLLGLALLPELFYAAFLDVVYVKGVLDIAFQREARWKHVSRPSSDEGVGTRPLLGAGAR